MQNYFIKLSINLKLIFILLFVFNLSANLKSTIMSLSFSRTHGLFLLVSDYLMSWCVRGLVVIVDGCITNPDFYGDVVYKLRKIMGHGNFSQAFTKIIKSSINRGYEPNILKHTACLEFNPLQLVDLLSSFNYV